MTHCQLNIIPPGQLNYALNMTSALLKTGHWIRQGYFDDLNKWIGVLVFPLVRRQELAENLHKAFLLKINVGNFLHMAIKAKDELQSLADLPPQFLQASKHT